jgi:tetratricopeptide (TPR) repeat protein/CHAT domain-containing protein
MFHLRILFVSSWALIRALLLAPALPVCGDAVRLSAGLDRSIDGQRRVESLKQIGELEALGRQTPDAQAPEPAGLLVAQLQGEQSPAEHRGNSDPYRPLARGRAALHAKDYHRAIAEFTDSIRLDPRNADAYDGRGQSYHRSGEFDHAIADYTEAMRLNPKNAVARVRRGNCHHDRAAYASAIVDYSEAIRLDPDKGVFWANRGNSYFGLGEIEKAIADYSSAIQIDPTAAEFYAFRAYTYSRSRGNDRAIADYSSALRLNPQSASYHFNRGVLYAGKGELDRAIADLTNAVGLDPGNAEALTERANCFTRKGEVDKAIADYTSLIRIDGKSAKAYSGRGDSFYRKGELDRAIADFTDSIRLTPNETACYTNRGVAYRTKGDYNKAVADFTAAIWLNPNRAETFHERAYAHRLNGDLDEAIADSNEAIRIAPKFAEAYHNRGWAYENNGDHAKALANFTEGIRLDPNNALGYRNRGTVYYKTRELDKAIADYSEAIRLDPKHPRAYHGRANAFYSKGDYDKAIADYGSAIHLGPNDASWYDDRGNAYLAKSDLDKAIADYSDAIRLDPKSAPALNDRAYAHRLKGDSDKAIADCNEAIRIAPSFAAAYHNRGWTYEKKGDHTRALADFSEGIRIDPKDAQAYRNRGDAYYCKRELDKAIADYSAAIQLGPKDARAYHKRANAFYSKGDYEKAIADYGSAIQFGPNDAAYYDDRGDAYRAKGDLDNAIADYSHAVRLDRKNADYSEHLRNAYNTHLHNLANSKHFVEAIALVKTMRPLFQSVYGDRATDNSLLTLARLYEFHEDFASAARAHEERMGWLAKRYGEKHPMVSDTRYLRDHVTLLGRLAPDQRRRLNEAKELDQRIEYLSRGRKYQDALAAARQAAAVCKETLGEQEPAYADSLGRIAELLRLMKEYAEAEKLHRQAAAIRLAVLGELHPNYATALNNLGVLYLGTGDHAKAVPLFRQAAAIYKVAYSAEDEHTVKGLNNLIEALERGADESVRREDLPTARKARQEILALQTELHGAKQWQTTDARVALAHLDRLAAFKPEQRRRLAEADRLDQSLKDIRQDYGPNVDDRSNEKQQLPPGAIATRDRYKKVLPLALQALAIRKEILGEKDPGYATSLCNLAVLHHLMGDGAQAEPLYRKVLTIRRDTLGEEHPQYASALNDLGALCVERSLTPNAHDYADAETMLRRASDLLKTIVGEKHGSYISSLYNLGALYFKTGEYNKAKPLLRQALKLREQVMTEAKSREDGLGELRKDLGMNKAVEGASDWFYAKIVGTLGALYAETGDYAAAEPLYRRALEVEKRVHGETSAEYARSMNDLAVLYSHTGDFPRAEALYRLAIQIDRQMHASGLPSYGLLNNLGRLYYEMRNYREAESTYQQALESYRKTHGEKAADDGDLLDNLALCYTAMGDYARAEPLYRQALKIKKHDQGEKHPRYAFSLNNLAYLHQKIGDYATAEPLYRQALEVYRPTLGEKHPEYSLTLYNLAQLYWEMGVGDKAEPLMRQALEAAATNLELAATVQSQRQQIGMAQTLRSRLDDYLSLLGTVDQGGETAYRHVLAWKGSALLRQRRIRLVRHDKEMEAARVMDVVNNEHGKPVALFSSLSSKYNELERIANWLSRILFAPAEAQPQFEDRRRLIQELTEAKERLEGELAAYSAWIRKVPETARLTPAQLQASLPPETVLVDLLEYTHSSPAQAKGKWSFEPRLAAFVVRRDQPIQRLDLGPVQPIANAVDAWRKSFDQIGNGKSVTPGADLRRLVWAPLEGCINGARVVLFSPDGPLARIPLAALPGKEPGSYLVEERAVVVVPVPQLLLELLAPVTAPQSEPTLLLVGDVAYDASPGTSDTAAPARSAPRGDPNQGGPKWPPLAHSQGEIAAIKSAFQDRYRHGAVTLLRQAGPTVREVCKQAPKHRYLHFATHGFFAPPQLRSELASSSKERAQVGDLFARRGVSDFHPGLLSGIVLAGANQAPAPDQDDGILTALEVAGLDLAGVELATLSACDTNLGESAGGEGLLGLQRAFQEAGARTVVATMWDVEDESARMLMERFYDNLWQKGMGRLAALREAQLWMLHVDVPPQRAERGITPLDGDPGAGRSRLASPRHWAAFVLSGDWR